MNINFHRIHHASAYRAWLLMLAVAVCVTACLRSTPDDFELPQVSRETPLDVLRLPQAAIWPLVFSRGGGTPEEIDGLEQWMRIEQKIAGRALHGGNRTRLLIDGPSTFQAMFKAMRQARHHIHLETFIFGDAGVSEELAEILSERHRAGVEVRMVIDGYGALESDERILEPLRELGIELFIYHPVSPLDLWRFWRINTRHHRKILIVDGRIGFLGGINISEVYASSSSAGQGISTDAAREGWRDSHLQVEGPIVAELQALFVAFWTRLNESAPLGGPGYFPELPEEGRALIRLTSSMVEDEAYEIYRTYMAAFASARRSIWITQGYFSPNRDFLEALKTASRRGVDVRLLLPGLTDSWVTISSSQAHYEELLEAGVRIFERRDVLQHAKTAVIDGIWSTVGSSNLDHRSFLHANEANLVIWGQEFAGQMENLFLSDQEKNQEITLTQWRQRPFRRILQEKFAALFDYWL